MSKFVKLLIVPVAILSLTTASFAQDFSMGDETKGMKVKISDETDISFRIRMQPRLDMGGLVTNEAGTSYESEIDSYLRRLRLEIDGNLVKELRYSLIFQADRNGKFASSGSPGNEVKIQIANIAYKFNDSFGVRFGKAKLPYSRVSLSSSSKQLIVEQPVSTEAAKKLFDDYYQSHLMFSGKVSEGLFTYNVAIADGWEPNSTIHSGSTTTTYSTTCDDTISPPVCTTSATTTDSAIKVHKSSPLYIARLEVSPPGWAESGQSDAHLGKGKHLTVGANYAAQKGIEYKSTAFEEDRTVTGLDVSGHWKGITGQFEYNTWKVDSTVPANSKEPKGWYIQAGYFVPGINLEPVARYEVYDQDSNSDNKQEKTTTVGVNWYLKGHSMKIGFNRVSTKYDTDVSSFVAADKDIYQLQAQLYF